MLAHAEPIRGWHVKAVLFVLLLLAIPACRGRSKATITGIVKYQGVLVPSGIVIFYGPDDQFASAPIRENGTYEATGVPVGAVRVTVTTGPSSAAMEKTAKQMKNRFGKGNPYPTSVNSVAIPAKYADPGKSGLELTVTGGAQKYNIEMD